MTVIDPATVLVGLVGAALLVVVVVVVVRRARSRRRSGQPLGLTIAKVLGELVVGYVLLALVLGVVLFVRYRVSGP